MNQSLNRLGFVKDFHPWTLINSIEMNRLALSQEVSRMQYQLENSSPQDASFNYTTNYEQTLEDPEPSTSQSNTYQVGNKSCSVRLRMDTHTRSPNRMLKNFRIS